MWYNKVLLRYGVSAETQQICEGTSRASDIDCIIRHNEPYLFVVAIDGDLLPTIISDVNDSTSGVKIDLTK